MEKETLRNVSISVWGGPRTKNFHKINDDPNNSAKKTTDSIVVIYLDDLLLIGRTYEEALIARDSIIFVTNPIRSDNNWEKSVLGPCQTMEFLGMIINNKEMQISLPTPKIHNLIFLCQETLMEKNETVRHLSSLIRKLFPNLPANSSPSSHQIFTAGPNTGSKKEMQLQQ